MEFMTWSHNAPSDAQFNSYMQKVDGKWTVINPDAPFQWPDVRRNMLHMFEKYHHKIKDFGLHEFGVRENGSIYDYRTSDYSVLDANLKVQSWVPTSLQYLMETYPDINYSLQFICFGQKNDKFLHTEPNSKSTFIEQARMIATQYRERGWNVNTIEIDFEKVYTLKKGDPIYDDRDDPNRTVIGYATDDDWEVYADFIKMVKDEVCIPLGMKLRVNMYAMTGDFVPSYYGWHDYKTLASRNDKNGNQAIDEFALMTYDFSWAGSAPGPSTPQWWLKQVLDHVANSLPEHKTWIGNAGYGRRWGLDNQQRGNVVTFNQITMWQNGMYKHSHGVYDSTTGQLQYWLWHDQDWLPFTGTNDEDSGYQRTYLHMYDKFSVTHSEDISGTVNRTTYGGFPIITSYFKSQQPIVTGVKAVVNNPQVSGNISGLYTSRGETSLGYHFPGAYRANRAQYQYDKNLGACVPVPDNTGETGKIVFNFDVTTPGTYRLIALVHFNTLDNDVVNASLNGTPFTIGGDNIYDWFPFFIDKSAWIDVGSFTFNSNNTIEIGVSKGYIWGFLVCESFDQRFLGGQVGFNSNLMPFYKRDAQGNPTLANMPAEMTITGEILRRPPRPAIIFEDTFSYLLNQESPGFDLKTLPYYMVTQDYWNSGPIKRWHEGEGAYACTDDIGFQRKGFSNGSWTLQKDGSVKGSANTGASSQLVLYKKFKTNIQVRADIAVTGLYPKAGIRLLASEEGNSQQGYLALLDYAQNKVVLLYEDGTGVQTEVASAWMSAQLEGLKGSTVSMYATILNGKAYVRVGDRTYINGATLTTVPTSGAYGVYISAGTVTLTMFNVSSMDRWEPLEKLEVEIDGTTYKYGEVNRGIPYDEYGYLIYTGLDIEGIDTGGGGTPDGGSASLEFDEDYKNLPIARHPSWVGPKQVKLRMVDAGIWIRNLYIGDSQGFSVAYNSDYIGFIHTTELINQYGCKGVAMWDIGQEDPLVYTYLPGGD